MQKTAYEVRISDWSSDVCSSDLIGGFRPVPGQFGVEPGRPGVAKGAAVASFLQRVDGDEAQFGQVDRILNEAVAVGQARKAGEEIVAQVVVADAGPDREGAARKGGFESAVAVGVAAVADVAGGEQQVRSEEHTSELQSLMR